jgi:hypothetical protein
MMKLTSKIVTGLAILGLAGSALAANTRPAAAGAVQPAPVQKVVKHRTHRVADAKAVKETKKAGAKVEKKGETKPVEQKGTEQKGEAAPAQPAAPEAK